MKKEYTKPSVIIENFKVNEFIAGACKAAGKEILPSSIKDNLNSSSVHSCIMDDGGGQFVFDDNCYEAGGMDGINKESCYQGIIGMYLNS